MIEKILLINVVISVTGLFILSNLSISFIDSFLGKIYCYSVLILLCLIPVLLFLSK